MINIIPMAGLGSRFSNVGYLLPKPLIPVSGKPMIAQVIAGLPPADRWIFVVRPEHITEYSIDTVLKSLVKNAEIIIDENPIGQASSTMLALLNVADDEEILISACDNSFLYDTEKFEALRTQKDVDSILWTFTKSDLLTKKPEAWGWAQLLPDGETVANMSVKVPVSDTPHNDHAVVATFYFKRAGDFKNAYGKMLAAEHRINGEYYIDAMPIFMNKIGKKTVIFDIDLYVSWGKPDDLYLYEYHELQHTQDNLTGLKDGALWEKFFIRNKRNISVLSNTSKLKTEIPRFLVQGCSAVLTDYLVYTGLLLLLTHSQSKALSFIAGTFVAYFIGKHWTFKHPEMPSGTLFPFLLLYSFTLTVNVATNSLMLSTFPSAILLAFLIATGASTILNFIGQKWWVFRPRDKQNGDGVNIPSGLFLFPVLFLTLFQFIATVTTITNLTFVGNIIMSALISLSVSYVISEKISQTLTISRKTLYILISAVLGSVFLSVLRLNSSIADLICPTGLINIVTQIGNGQFPASFSNFPNFPMNYHQGTLFLAGTLVFLTKISAGMAIKATLATLYGLLVSTTMVYFIAQKNKFYFLVPILFIIVASLSPKFYVGMDLGPYNFISIFDIITSNTWPLTLSTLMLILFTIKAPLTNLTKYVFLVILLLCIATINATAFIVTLIALTLLYTIQGVREKKSYYYFGIILLTSAVVYTLPSFIPSAFLKGSMYAPPEYTLHIMEMGVIKYLKQMARFLMLGGPIIVGSIFIIYLSLKQHYSKERTCIALLFLISLCFPFLILVTNVDMWDNLHKFVVICMFTAILLIVSELGKTNRHYNTLITIIIITVIISLPALFDIFTTRISTQFSNYTEPPNTIYDIVTYLEKKEVTILPYMATTTDMCTADGYNAVAQYSNNSMYDTYFTNFLLSKKLETKYTLEASRRSTLDINGLFSESKPDEVILVDKSKLTDNENIDFEYPEHIIEFERYLLIESKD